MVARSGNPKGNTGEMNYTLVGDDFSIHTMKGDKLAQSINSNKIKVNNMAVTAKGLVSTNGAIDKYTTFDNFGNIIGTPRCVVLNRIEKNGKLSGYVLFTNTGVITQIDIASASKLAINGLIANGKVRHTAEGDIVSSITGQYPLVEIQLNDVKEETPNIDVVFFGSAISGGKAIHFGGVTVTSKSSKTIAKMFTTLNSASIRLREKLAEDYGYSEDELKSFEFKQAPGAGFYGVYPIDTVNKLMGSGKVKCSIGKLMVGCSDRSDKDNPESIAVVDMKKKSIVNSQEGTAKSDEKLKKYVADVLNKF